MLTDFDNWSIGFTNCLRLLYDQSTDLDTYLDTAQGWEILGARDAIDYYTMCDGRQEFWLTAKERWWQEQHYQKIYSPNPKFDPEKYSDV